MTVHRISDEEIDRALAHDAIVPSSGFADGVMTKVRESVGAGPPPLAFPWMRALPGAAALVFAGIGTIVREGTTASSSTFGPALSLAGGPIALALVVAAASLACSWAVVRSAPHLAAMGRARRAGV
jgi:hypothetical protein